MKDFLRKIGVNRRIEEEKGIIGLLPNDARR
jgi:hypothetical protein